MRYLPPFGILHRRTGDIGAGCAAASLNGCQISGGRHAVINALAILTGVFFDGARSSCAAKAAAADAWGYEMYEDAVSFREGGILSSFAEEIKY